MFFLLVAGAWTTTSCFYCSSNQLISNQQHSIYQSQAQVRRQHTYSSIQYSFINSFNHSYPESPRRVHQSFNPSIHQSRPDPSYLSSSTTTDGPRAGAVGQQSTYFQFNLQLHFFYRFFSTTNDFDFLFSFSNQHQQQHPVASSASWYNFSLALSLVTSSQQVASISSYGSPRPEVTSFVIQFGGTSRRCNSTES